jgi:threonine dehydrogenase-like Zn-dependent dehydrogenase
MAGICGTDVHLWKGELKLPLPLIMGHETVGRIEKLGEQVDTDWRDRPIRAGDRVTWASSIVCGGECFYCRVKRQPTRCVARKAGGISTDAVIGAGRALSTALHGLERAPVSLGDVVVVQGTGPVGLAALTAAHQSGAKKVIAMGGPVDRLARAREFGADAVIPVDEAPDPGERQEFVLDATGSYGADVVVECVGHPSVMPEEWELCRDGGKYVVLGQYANAGDVSLNPHTITRKQLQIVGS